jgi:hypothetical protein
MSIPGIAKRAACGYRISNTALVLSGYRVSGIGYHAGIGYRHRQRASDIGYHAGIGYRHRQRVSDIGYHAGIGYHITIAYDIIHLSGFGYRIPRNV